MQYNQTNEYLKTIGTAAISLLLMATLLGITFWHIIHSLNGGLISCVW